jgi:hypothetical protein
MTFKGALRINKFAFREIWIIKDVTFFAVAIIGFPLKWKLKLQEKLG